MACVRARFFLLGLMLGGCMQATLEPATDANFTPRDKKLLANAPYAQATIPQAYQRHIVDYHRAEAPGSIVVDSDARYLYYVLPNRKAIRYGVTVGEDALSFWGIAKVGRKEEWPSLDADRGHQAAAPQRSGLASKAARTIRSARAASICSRAAATRCSASTAPTSRNISGRRSPRAASA